MKTARTWVWGLALLPLAACGISKDVYQKDVGLLRDQLNATEREKAECVQARDGLRGERDRLTEELAALGRDRSALSADLQKALARMEELRQQAERRKAKLRELRAKLQEMVAAGKLKVRVDKGRMIVEMAEKVLFDSGKFKLKPEGLEALAQLTSVLRSIEGRAFQVTGHTDDVGGDEYNWTLSLNRAREVVLQMIEMGMPPERLSAAGYGKFSPVAPNDTPEGRAQNRRIEIVLVPNLDELLGFEDE
ncbi:OmpA family protein [Myxococcota bacterium]|jgi:chemotaxis protein MotB|nr:OmpA family protein [Myxococcota bacterium]